MLICICLGYSISQWSQIAPSCILRSALNLILIAYPNLWLLKTTYHSGMLDNDLSSQLKFAQRTIAIFSIKSFETCYFYVFIYLQNGLPDTGGVNS